jgi:predicted helicase
MQWKRIVGVQWEELMPDAKNTWLTSATGAEFAEFTPIGLKEAKADAGSDVPVIFQTYSLGVATNRDDWVFDFDRDALAKKTTRMITNFNAELSRYDDEGRPDDLDSFVNNDPAYIKWTDRLKEALTRGEKLRFDAAKIRKSQYRPFTREYLYFDHLLNQRRYQQQYFFPTAETESENRAIITPGAGNRQAFGCFICDRVPALDFAFEKAQCFPFYTYDEIGMNRRENIPLSTLLHFQSHYGDERITKWDIFYYVYAVLHHPGYRERFAANLKRELPRIPFAPDFRAFAKAGHKLADLHIGYEEAAEFPLKRIEHRDVPFTLRVEAMKLTPDKQALKYNESLTLEGIPPKVFDYKLGNRSALDWVIDQYRVSTDPRSGIESDPNRADDENYILRLVGQVVTVSVETQKIVEGLPEDFGAEGEQSEHDHKLETWRLNQSLPNSGSAQKQMERLQVEANSHSATALSLSEAASSYGPAKRASRPGGRLPEPGGGHSR